MLQQHMGQQSSALLRCEWHGAPARQPAGVEATAHAADRRHPCRFLLKFTLWLSPDPVRTTQRRLAALQQDLGQAFDSHLQATSACAHVPCCATARAGQQRCELCSGLSSSPKAPAHGRGADGVQPAGPRS